MAAPNKAPSYPWYPRDFAMDEPVQLMSLEEEGAYRRLLDHQWLHGSIPSDLSQLARICKGIPVARMRRFWRAIEPLFPADPDDPERRVNRKLERVRHERDEYVRQQSASGKRGAAARWRDRRTDGDPNGEPNGDPNGVAIATPMASPMANRWLAFASASAIGTTPSPPPARDGAPVASSWPQLHAKLPPTGLYRQQVAEFLGSVPDAAAEGWCAVLRNQLAGVGTPGGAAVSPDELLTALAEYQVVAKGQDTPALFAGIVRKIIQRRYQGSAPNGAAPPAPGKKLPRLTHPDTAAAS